MADYLKRCWAVVNLDNVAHNIGAIRKTLSPNSVIMGVVKADAYGHGDKYIADELVRLGVNWFGVSNIEEAVSLRCHGISQPILVFGVTPAESAGLLNKYNITQTVHSAEYGRELHEAVSREGVTVDIHIKIDTGMSRLGFASDDLHAGKSIAEIVEISKYTGLNAQGIFTHFACADELAEDSAAYTRMQYGRVCSMISRLEESGLNFALRHCCNSAATALYPEMHMDMVRIGIMLYGLNPGSGCVGRIDIKPVMELYTAISMVKEIDVGTPVSYGRSFTANRKTKVATVPVGYADGFARGLSNKARMLIKGRFANVIGRVCMDQLMLDVTHIDDVKAGDIVTVVGEDSGETLTFDEMAELSGTINYEKACLIGKRVPRIYRRGGKDVGVVDYVKRG